MALLEVQSLKVFHGDLQALFDVCTRVEEGGVLALIGANGAGKSTLLSVIAGLIGTGSGSAAGRGSIRFDGREILGRPAEALAKAGIALVPEGRMLFPSLSVEENLLMGTLTRRRGPWSLERVYSLFPILREFRSRPGTSLSGGQQQMVAIARALMSNPRLLLCDEISLGLAPLVVQQIYESFAQIRSDGLAIVLVEQDVARARAAADTVCCLLKGRVTLQGASRAFTQQQISHAYFGH